jgi:hypothetical protein
MRLCCTNCGHEYCDSCFENPADSLSAKQEKTGVQNSMRLFGTAYSPGSEAKLSTHVRGFATQKHTASNVDLRDEPSSPRETSTIPQILYTLPLKITPIDQGYSPLAEAKDVKTIDGPLNSSSYLSPLGMPATEDADDEETTEVDKKEERQNKGRRGRRCVEPYCGRVFSRSEGRLKHYRNHHPWLVTDTTVVGEPHSAQPAGSSRTPDLKREGSNSSNTKDPKRFKGHKSAKTVKDIKDIKDVKNIEGTKGSKSRIRLSKHVSDSLRDDKDTPREPLNQANLDILGNFFGMEMEGTTLELKRVLQDDKSLVNLYQLAFKDANVGPDRLQRNLRRLIRQMAKNLMVEANGETERQISRFVAKKARILAHRIVEDLRNTQISIRQQWTNESLGEKLKDSESEQGDWSIDETLFEDLTSFRSFLVESNAFQSFHSRLAAFATPKAVRVTEAKVENENAHTDYWGLGWSVALSRLGELYMAVVGSIGSIEPPISSKAVRLRWQCVSRT